MHALPYFKQVKQCEDAERRLNYLQNECRKHYVTVSPPDNEEIFASKMQEMGEKRQKAVIFLLEEIQKDIEKQDKFIQEQNLRLNESEETLLASKECF